MLLWHIPGCPILEDPEPYTKRGCYEKELKSI